MPDSMLKRHGWVIVWWLDDVVMNYYLQHPLPGFRHPRWWTAVLNNDRCFQILDPPRSLLEGCTSNHVECHSQTLAGIPDTTLIPLSVRKCEYISNHNRLMPEMNVVRFENSGRWYGLFMLLLIIFHQIWLTYFHIRTAFKNEILSALATASCALLAIVIH